MLIALSGALLGLAVALVLIPFLPVRPRLADAMRQLSMDPAEAVEISLTGRDRIGAWAEKRSAALPFLGGVPRQDLALIERPSTTHFYKKALTAGVLFLAGIALGPYAALLGFPALLPMLLSLPLAYVGWRLPDADVRREAASARASFKRAIGIYVELIAAERKRNAPVGTAMERAATVSDSWIFRQIRQELTRARYDNQEPWVALEKLAERIAVPELAETASLLGLSGVEGAAVYDSLRGMGRSMRMNELAQEQTRSNKITEQLNLTITALAGVFVMLLLVPTIMTLMN